MADPRTVMNTSPSFTRADLRSETTDMTTVSQVDRTCKLFFLHPEVSGTLKRKALLGSIQARYDFCGGRLDLRQCVSRTRHHPERRSCSGNDVDAKISHLDERMQ
jgi:hypothetical protein